jgi:hypothetical protein
MRRSQDGGLMPSCRDALSDSPLDPALDTRRGRKSRVLLRTSTVSARSASVAKSACRQVRMGLDVRCVQLVAQLWCTGGRRHARVWYFRLCVWVGLLWGAYAAVWVIGDGGVFGSIPVNGRVITYLVLDLLSTALTCIVIVFIAQPPIQRSYMQII